MPRKPRIEFHGALYHVISRGNQRNDTFLSDADYKDYLTRLCRYHEKFDFILYSYCLMPNHVHLLIETRNTPLSRIMHPIQFSYTQTFHKRHKTCGHVFQGRYKAILCNRDKYLMALIRYINLNPIRKHLVDDPKDYIWSSHREILGLDHPRFDANAVLALFGKRRVQAIKNYESFVLAGIGEGHNDSYYTVKEQRVLGDDDFVEEILSEKPDEKRALHYNVSLDEIVYAVCQKTGVSLNTLRSLNRNRKGSHARAMVVYLAKTAAGISTKKVADYFNRSDSNMSQAFSSIETMMNNDSDAKKLIEDLYNQLTSGKRILIANK